MMRERLLLLSSCLHPAFDPRPLELVSVRIGGQQSQLFERDSEDPDPPAQRPVVGVVAPLEVFSDGVRVGSCSFVWATDCGRLRGLDWMIDLGLREAGSDGELRWFRLKSSVVELVS